MTKEESTPDFEHLLQASNTAEFPTSQAASPPSMTPRNESNSIADAKKGSSSELTRDTAEHEHNGVLEGVEKMDSNEMTTNHTLENGDCEDTSADTKTSEASNSLADTVVKDIEKIAPVKMGSSRKRKSKPVKLQKPRRKSIMSQPSVIHQAKPIAPAPSPGSNTCSSPVTLSTTETMIRSIPDLFKNASIGTETTPLQMTNGSMTVGQFETEAAACEDFTAQIDLSVLPPFAPPLPPERFNLPAPDQQHCCLDCGDQFWMESSLTQHLQRRSIYITFNCATCKKLLVFYNRCTLLGHVRVHHDRGQPADIQQASVSPLPHELIQCIQDQRSAEGAASSPKATSTPVVTIIIPPNSDNILTVTKPNHKPASKCKCPECHYQCGSFSSLQEHLGCGQNSPAESGAQCPQCNMVCPSRCGLLCHQRIHAQSKPYLCPECGQNAAEKWDDFQRHLAIECMHYSRTIGFKCPACGLLVVTPEQMRHHVVGSHSEFYYKCQACPMAFRAEASFNAHRKTVHMLDSLHCTTIRKCPLCEVVFQSDEVLQNHLEIHFQEVLKSSMYLFMCLECNQLFEEKNQLGQHLQSSHVSLFEKGAVEHRADKKRLGHPRKRVRPIGKLKAPPAKATHLSNRGSNDVQNEELSVDKALKPKVFKSRVFPKSKSPKSGEASLGESPAEHSEVDPASRREPRIPPLVLSLKDRVPNNASSSLVIKKFKADPDSSGMTCEDCGRTFTTLIGCRVHRQRSHMANYKFKKQYRLTLDRRNRRPVQEIIHAHKITDDDSSKPVEEAQRAKSSAQSSKSDIPAEKRIRSARRRSSSSSSASAAACEECGRIFHSFQGLSTHRQRCHGAQDNVKSKCAVCQELYHDPHSMAEHGQMHLKEGTLVCTLCNNLVFSTKLALSKHIENHACNVQYPVSCPLCDEELVSSDPAIEHWRKEHGLLSFHCPQCDAQYLYKKSLNRHIHAAHGPAKNKQEFKCRLCVRDAFQSSALLKKHMEENHSASGNDVRESATDTKICEEPDATEAPTVVKTEPLSPESARVKDERKPKAEKAKDVDSEEYSCAKCDFKTGDRPTFQSHITTDHRAESDSYQCLECGTSFVVEPSLKKHLACTHKVKDLETFLLERGYAVGSAVSNNEDPNDGGRVSVGNASNGGQSEGGGKTNPLECSVCFLSLESESALKTHSRTHGMAFIRSKRNARVNSQSSENTPNTTPTKSDV